MYVANMANGITGAVTEYAPGAHGNAAPVATIGGAATKLTEPDAVGFDGAGDLFVDDSISVFAPDATGSVAPVATVARAATGLSAPEAVAVVPPLSILTKHLPGGIVRHLYHATLQAALGTTPYRWALTHGRLPAGLRLSRDGSLSGVPRRPARRWVTIAVTDAGHPRMTAHRRFLLTVRCPTIGRHRTCTINHVTRRPTSPFHPRRRLDPRR